MPQTCETSGQSLSVSYRPDLPLSVASSVSMNKQTLSVSNPKSLSVIPPSIHDNFRELPKRNIRKPIKFNDYV